MAKYQVTVVQRPENWAPESADDVPLDLIGPVAVLAESDDLFEALDRAIEHNQSAESQQSRRWAIVVEPGCAGRAWPMARVCTPITYRVAPIWWPDGWEPQSPLDVPSCVWQAKNPTDAQWLTYPQAEATMLGLNRQCMSQPGGTWYIVVAVENEPVARTVSCDPAGTETTVEVRRTHTIRPLAGGYGDCAHCPAGTLPCARTEWLNQVQAVPVTHRRAY